MTYVAPVSVDVTNPSGTRLTLSGSVTLIESETGPTTPDPQERVNQVAARIESRAEAEINEALGYEAFG